MSGIDWTLALALNGAIITYAILGARRADSSSEWFLGGRSVPWLIVGVSAFATAIDSSDLVADSGGVYTLGIRYFVTNWVGTVIGWMLLAHVIAVPMYRAGMYTNSEYLEARFGPVTRVLSGLVQVQYRTMVIANISTTLFLTFSVVGGLGSGAWWMVAAIVVLSTTYTIVGGSRSVASTDAVQSIVMIAAGVVLFVAVWNAVEGWQGIERRLGEYDASLPDRMTRVGSRHAEQIDVDGQTALQIARLQRLGGEYDASSQTITRYTPAWLACLSFILVGMAYSIVNHEQSMRLFAARSVWDMKMSAAVAGLLLIVMTFFNLMMGIMGRAMFPHREALPVDEPLRQTADAIYPILVRDFTSVGFKGIVVAGLLAAAMSTYAGIGAAMAAVLTRDVYARLLVRDRDDRHYLVAGRWFTLAVVLGSFLYVPFLLRRGMMMFYLDLVAAFVIPLLTIYLMGIFTRVHRRSGAIGLVAGVIYGALRLVAAKVAIAWGVVVLPPVACDSFAAYPISLAITAGTMVLVSLVFGWESRAGSVQHPDGGWAQRSRMEAQSVDTSAGAQRSNAWPIALGLGVVGIGAVLSFVVFW